MKFWLAAVFASLTVASSEAAIVYTSLAEFEAVAGKPRQSVDLTAGALPRCTELWYYRAYGEVVGSCIASRTQSGGTVTITVRGYDAWVEGVTIRSGTEDGSAFGAGSAYMAHLWSGPGGNIVADPLGGDRLGLSIGWPIGLLGIHTTAGFFGWQGYGVDSSLLILPAGAEITRFDVDYAPHAAPEPASILLVSLAIAGMAVVTRRRTREVSPGQ